MKIMTNCLMLKVPFFAFITVGLSACGSQINCLGFSGTQSNIKSMSSGSINISIDGSGSMKGFAASSNSLYQRVIEELDSILGVSPALNMPATKTQVFRIGRQSSPSEDPDQPIVLNSLMTARRIDLYEPTANSSWPKVSSSIDQFVTQDPGSLDILISDLEPDDASIKQLLTAVMPKLKQNPNKKSWWPGRKERLAGNQLTLIGMKSQFNGGVFPSVKGAFPSFPFKVLRPFYILILGPVEQSELLINRLTSLNLDPGQWQISRFAANPAYGKTNFYDQSQTSVQPEDCFYPAFSINKGLSGKLRFDDAKKWLIMKKGNLCQSNQLRISFVLPELQGFGSNIISEKNILNVRNALPININIAENQSSIQLESSIPSGSINVIEASLKSDQLDRRKWLDWNMDPSSPNGTKTQRLLRLVNSLRSETDLYAMKEFAQKYSPLRLCAAIKS